ncbi:unnamed protein product, partial [Gulo gulo]
NTHLEPSGLGAVCSRLTTGTLHPFPSDLSRIQLVGGLSPFTSEESHAQLRVTGQAGVGTGQGGHRTQYFPLLGLGMSSVALSHDRGLEAGTFCPLPGSVHWGCLNQQEGCRQERGHACLTCDEQMQLVTGPVLYSIKNEKLRRGQGRSLVHSAGSVCLLTSGSPTSFVTRNPSHCWVLSVPHRAELLFSA